MILPPLVFPALWWSVAALALGHLGRRDTYRIDFIYATLPKVAEASTATVTVVSILQGPMLYKILQP